MPQLARLREALYRDDHDAMDNAIDELVAAGWTGDEINDHVGQWTAAWIANGAPELAEQVARLRLVGDDDD
jgi:hypothetical protein